jgi:hypothetical protein
LRKESYRKAEFTCTLGWEQTVLSYKMTHER